MTLPAPPERLAVELEDSLRGVVALGLLEAHGLRHAPLGAAFDAERSRVVARCTAQWSDRQPGDIPGVAEVRSLFHRLGVDPTKTRPSSEALLRRVLQGKGLPVIDPIVDVCNLCSLEHQLPLGLYDRERVRGVVRVRAGLPGEGYEGIRKGRVNVVGRLMLADDTGAFGAPTNDSLRTSVTAETGAVLVVAFCPLPRARDELGAALESLSGRLARFCEGEVVAVRTVS
ncbi:MAG: B3/4 domain-containing protein [Candidatus Eisenbacteria bacterium]